MVPLAWSSVGRSRLSTLTVWNSSGLATVMRFGSTVTSCLVGAALVSFEQATAKASRIAQNNRAARRWRRAGEIVAASNLGSANGEAVKNFGAAAGGRAETAASQQEPAAC